MAASVPGAARGSLLAGLRPSPPARPPYHSARGCGCGGSDSGAVALRGGGAAGGAARGAAGSAGHAGSCSLREAAGAAAAGAGGAVTWARPGPGGRRPAPGPVLLLLLPRGAGPVAAGVLRPSPGRPAPQARRRRAGVGRNPGALGPGGAALGIAPPQSARERAGLGSPRGVSSPPLRSHEPGGVSFTHLRFLSEGVGLHRFECCWKTPRFA